MEREGERVREMASFGRNKNNFFRGRRILWVDRLISVKGSIRENEMCIRKKVTLVYFFIYIE